MNELRSLTASLAYQRRRLKQLVEMCGGLDPNNPMQQFSVRRIEWLEKRIEEVKKQA